MKENLIKTALFPLAAIQNRGGFINSSISMRYEAHRPAYIIRLEDGRIIIIPEWEMVVFISKTQYSKYFLLKKKLIPKFLSEDEFYINRLRVFLFSKLAQDCQISSKPLKETAVF